LNFERKELTFDKLKDKAMRLLARRDHSERELKSKLKQRGRFSDEDFGRVLEWLKDLGYMGDEQDLAGRWIKQWRSEGRGRMWITGKLRTKGLKAPDLRDDEDEETAARTFIDKKLRGKSLSSLSFDEKAKLSRSLISRGFSTSIVATVISRS
jgi:regulatory protein